MDMRDPVKEKSIRFDVKVNMSIEGGGRMENNPWIVDKEFGKWKMYQSGGSGKVKMVCGKGVMMGSGPERLSLCRWNI